MWRARTHSQTHRFHAVTGSDNKTEPASALSVSAPPPVTTGRPELLLTAVNGDSLSFWERREKKAAERKLERDFNNRLHEMT